MLPEPDAEPEPPDADAEPDDPVPEPDTEPEPDRAPEADPALEPEPPPVPLGCPGEVFCDPQATGASKGRRVDSESHLDAAARSRRNARRAIVAICVDYDEGAFGATMRPP